MSFNECRDITPNHSQEGTKAYEQAVKEGDTSWILSFFGERLCLEVRNSFIQSIQSVNQFKQAVNQSLLHSATLLNFSSKISNPWEVGIPKVEESNVDFAEALVYQCSFGVFGSSIIPSNAGWGGKL